MKRILIVDDDDEFREVLCDYLGSRGFETVGAPDGRQALEGYAAHPFDAVVMDVLMPEMDGIEAIFSFRRRFPGTRIVMISGGGRHRAATYLDLAAKAGAAATLEKPFKPERLVEVLNEALAQE